MSLCDEMCRPIRFELRLHAQIRFVAQKDKSGGDVVKTSVKSENVSGYLSNPGCLRNQ